MSYILDALKKSEKKRQEERNSTVLNSPQHPPPPIPRRKAVFPLLSILFCICIAAGIIGYLAFSNHDGALTTDLRQAARQIDSTSPPLEKQLVVGSEIPELRPLGKKQVTVEDASTNVQEILEPRPLQPQQANRESLQIPAEEAFPNIPYLEELDPAFKESVPEFKFAGHVYSKDHALRMIVINNTIAREGDIVEKDYVLDEITPDGVILRSGTLRFQMKAY